MRARRILQAGVIDPEELARLQHALDIAWEGLEPTIPPADHLRSRELLATFLVTTGKISGLDPNELADAAVQGFRANQIATHQHLPNAGGMKSFQHRNPTP